MVVFPIISIFLVFVSCMLTLQNKKDRNIIPPQISLVLNGLFFLFLVVFTSLFLQNNDVMTQIPASYYLFLIAAGIIIEFFSFRKKYAPGHITAASIHCFVGFVAIFSIGLLLLILALFELSIVVYQHRIQKKLIV